MKFEFNKRYNTIALYAFLVLAAAALFSGFLGNLKYFERQIELVVGLLTPFIYGFAIAYLLNPVLKFFEHDCLDRLLGDRINDRPKRGLSILLTYLFAAGLIAAFGGIVMPQLVLSLTRLINRLTVYVNTADTWMPVLLSYFPEIDLPTTLSTYIGQYADTIAQTTLDTLKKLVPWVVTFSTNFASGLLQVIVGVIVSIYMLSDKERFCAGIKKILYAFLPNKNADWLLELSSDANRIFGGFISGKLLDSLIIGILCFICMTLMNMPNTMLVSVIVGVTNVIPYFGPFIGAIPSFFIILIDHPIKSLWFIVFIFLLQQFDGNILGPKILGDSTGLSAFWVVFSIMLLGGFYGFLGMFLGVPVWSFILMLIRKLIASRLYLRSMPVELDSYCSPEAPLPRDPSGKSASKEKKFHVGRRAHTVQPIGKKKPSEEEEEE